MEFNLQQFLSEMRAEHRADIEGLRDDIQCLIRKHGIHDTRITQVEQTQHNVQRFSWGLFVGMITFVFEQLSLHMPKLFSKGAP